MVLFRHCMSHNRADQDQGTAAGAQWGPPPFRAEGGYHLLSSLRRESAPAFLPPFTSAAFSLATLFFARSRTFLLFRSVIPASLEGRPALRRAEAWEATLRPRLGGSRKVL